MDGRMDEGVVSWDTHPMDGWMDGWIQHTGKDGWMRI
jgi:hypothetical protein